MFQITKRETVTITPAEAFELLKLNEYPTQRILRPKWVITLSNRILCGDFTTGSLNFSIDLKGKKLLMNGQHQLSAIIIAGMATTCHVEEALCATEEDISRYYSQFNVDASRSIGDVVWSVVGSIRPNWLKKTGTTMAGALSFIGPDGNHKHPNKDETKHEKAIRIVEANNLSAGDFVDDLFGGINSRHLQRAPVAVVMVMSFKKDHLAATGFWGPVRTGANLDVNDPRLHLRSFLIKYASSHKTSNSLGKSARANDKEVITRCIKSWNAWRKGKERKTIGQYFPEGTIPKVI